MAIDARALLMAGVAAVGAALPIAADTGPASASGSFPCVWHWSLTDGLPAGYVVASSNADCPALPDSLTLHIRLLVRPQGTQRWHTQRVKTKTWRSAKGAHGLSIMKPCAVEQARAIFRWTLRRTGGSVAARHVVRTGILNVPGPGCRIVLAAARGSHPD